MFAIRVQLGGTPVIFLTVLQFAAEQFYSLQLHSFTVCGCTVLQFAAFSGGLTVTYLEFSSFRYCAYNCKITVLHLQIYSLEVLVALLTIVKLQFYSYRFTVLL
jgi:hypothetical protein